MNGNAAEVLHGVSVGNPDVIRLLEQVLADARAGRIVGVALAFTAGPGSMSAAAAGGHHPELYMGCDAIKGQLLQNSQRRPSPILTPGR